jgi:hypothetical protein
VLLVPYVADGMIRDATSSTIREWLEVKHPAISSFKRGAPLEIVVQESRVLTGIPCVDVELVPEVSTASEADRDVGSGDP